MTVQWGTTLRNNELDQFETTIGTAPLVQIYTGAQPADCATGASGTKLAEFSLDSDWMSAAASGQKAMIKGGATVTTSNFYSTTGLAAGNAGYYRIMNTAGSVCHEQGSVTATGGGGDITLDNVSIAVSQQTQLTGYNKTAPSP